MKQLRQNWTSGSQQYIMMTKTMKIHKDKSNELGEPWNLLFQCYVYDRRCFLEYLEIFFLKKNMSILQGLSDNCTKIPKCT